MRMPWAASGNDRNAVYALIASFERPYALRELGRMRLAPRACGGEVGRRQQRAEELQVRHPPDACRRRDRCDRTVGVLEHLRDHLFGELPQPAEVDEHHVEVGERVRQPGAVEEHVDDAADLVGRRFDLLGVAQVALGEAGEAGHVGLAEVDRVHLRAELDEDPRRRRAHARGRAGDDHALARVAEHVHAPRLLLDRDRALRAVLGADAGLVGGGALDVLRDDTQCPKSSGSNTSGASA